MAIYSGYTLEKKLFVLMQIPHEEPLLKDVGYMRKTRLWVIVRERSFPALCS